jgi:hypothetical protein
VRRPEHRPENRHAPPSSSSASASPGSSSSTCVRWALLLPQGRSAPAAPLPERCYGAALPAPALPAADIYTYIQIYICIYINVYIYICVYIYDTRKLFILMGPLCFQIYLHQLFMNGFFHLTLSSMKRIRHSYQFI